MCKRKRDSECMRTRADEVVSVRERERERGRCGDSEREKECV